MNRVAHGASSPEACRVPTFAVVGAARSGTTTLHYTLDQHPNITMSRVKEPNFFVWDGERLDYPWPAAGNEVRSEAQRSYRCLESYLELFSGPGTARGDVTPSYLVSPGAAARMKRLNPALKIIAILRHPAERATSHIRLSERWRGSRGHLDFTAILQEHHEHLGKGALLRGKAAAPYVPLGMYYRGLLPYYQTFGPERVSVHLYEEFTEPEQLLKKLYAFVGVDSGFTPNTAVQYNPSGESGSGVHARLRALPLARRLFKSAKRLLPRPLASSLTRYNDALKQRDLRPSQQLTAAERREITRTYYAEDITHLQTLIGRDLSSWLE